MAEKKERERERCGKRGERGRRKRRGEGWRRERKQREVAAVRKLLFKIGIPLRLVGTRNADRVEATKTVRVDEGGRGGGRGEGGEARAPEKKMATRGYCLVITEKFVISLLLRDQCAATTSPLGTQCLANIFQSIDSRREYFEKIKKKRR